MYQVTASQTEQNIKLVRFVVLIEKKLEWTNFSHF